MQHTKPNLPYTLDALAPYISTETLEFHSGKHHQTYVDNLNRLIVGTPHEEEDLETIVRDSSGGIFNNAAQVWNHTFYFESLAPAGTTTIDVELEKALILTWGSVEAFIVEFNKVALATFGSGWAWLVQKADGSLEITSTSNAGSPISKHFGGGKDFSKKDTPLLTCDVWEHAYYIDVRNARAKYLENFWKVVNWKIVGERMRK